MQRLEFSCAVGLVNTSLDDRGSNYVKTNLDHPFVTSDTKDLYVNLPINGIQKTTEIILKGPSTKGMNKGCIFEDI